MVSIWLTSGSMHRVVYKLIHTFGPNRLTQQSCPCVAVSTRRIVGERKADKSNEMLLMKMRHWWLGIVSKLEKRACGQRRGKGSFRDVTPPPSTVDFLVIRTAVGMG